MSRFTVIWQPEAIEDLAELLMATADADGVTRATQNIQMLLTHNPQVRGSEVSEGLRSLISRPLRVAFDVREEDRVVDVWRVYPI